MRFPPALLVILVLTLILRLPSLFEPYWYGDEGIFAAVAHQMLQGDLLYRDTWDNKPPMIYLLYAAVFAVFGVELFWVKLLATLSILGTQLLLFFLLRRLTSDRITMAGVAVFGFLVSLPTLEGNLALTEIFMLPAIVGAWFIALARPQQLFWAGVLMSIPFLLKPVAGLEFAALFFFVVFIKTYVWRQRVFLCLGFAVLPTLHLFLFTAWGALHDFIFAAFLFFGGYLAWTPGQTQTSSDLLLKIGLFSLVVTLTFIWSSAKRKDLFELLESERPRSRRPEPQSRWPELVEGSKRTKEKNAETIAMLVLWFAAAWTSALFAGRPYPHYLIEAGTVTAIMLTLTPTLLRSTTKAGRAFLLLTLFLFFIRGAMIFPSLRVFTDQSFLRADSYYQNFLALVAKDQSVASYNDWFDTTVNRNEKIGAFLQQKLGPDKRERRVYLWGDAPWIYSRANLDNPVRYVVAFHALEIPSGRENVIQKLQEHPPSMIIVLHSTAGFPALERLLAKQYKETDTVAGAAVFSLLQ
ncbi:MAG: glycosyltransferase family 39 protein [bacterium]|nr:glycosyltransferase family 39 protein [bacterium]